jgi:hypothetical protein
MSIDPKKFGLSDSLVNAVNEALKGGQKNLDKAPPFGKLTGDDFKKLRGEGSKPTNEVNDYFKRRKRERDVEAGRPVTPLPKNPQNDYAKKRAEQKAKQKEANEEVENVDELSKAAVGSYLKKSPQDLKNLEALRGKDESLPNHIRRNRMQNNRTVGIIRGVNKLTGNAKVPAKEEVEGLDELGNMTLQSYRNATFKPDAYKGGTNRDDYSPEAKAKRERTRMNRDTGRALSYDKTIGKAKSGINSTEINKKANEEVEQVDELTSKVYYSAFQKAQKKASWLMPGDKGKGDKAWNRVKKFRDAGVEKEKQERSIKKEEVEGLDELKGIKSGFGKLGYLGKASKVIRKTDPKDIANDPDTERKFKNRMTGLKNLLKRTQKEEVVDEAQTKQQRAARAALATQGGSYDGGKKGGAINRMALMKPKDLKKLAIAKEEVEQIDEIGDTPQVRKKLRDYLVKANKSGAAAHVMYKTGKASGNEADPNTVRTLRNRGSGIRNAKARINRGMYREEVVDEAVAGTNVAADMAARKTDVQRRIAQKQASFQQAKANRRISSSTIREAKCSCGEAKGSKMTCEMHGDKKTLKGGKEPILMNPPLKETYSKTKY